MEQNRSTEAAGINSEQYALMFNVMWKIYKVNVKSVVNKSFSWFPSLSLSRQIPGHCLN
jgi:hypothetical protein